MKFSYNEIVVRWPPVKSEIVVDVEHNFVKYCHADARSLLKLAVNKHITAYQYRQISLHINNRSTNIRVIFKVSGGPHIVSAIENT